MLITYRRPAWFAPLALLTAASLVAGVGAAVVVRPAPKDAVPPQSITLSPTSTATPGLTGVNKQIAEAIPSIMRFDEKARGLAYKRPVKITLLGDAAFRKRLKGTESKPTDKEIEQTRTNERVLRALGLLDKGVDLDKATSSLLGAAVAGFYDTKHHDLVVRGEKLTPFVRVTFAHELTHALQDQYFKLSRDDLDKRDDEAAQAFTALVEGDAMHVEQLYTDQLSDEDQKQAQLEEMGQSSGIDPSTPRVLLELIGFPYAAGPRFVAALVAAGGNDRLNKAFENPPTTSEQIMHPDVYLRGEGAAAVASPKPPGKLKEIDKGVLGELGLLLVLSHVIPAKQAQTAAAGWGGDRYTAWREASGDQSCVAVNAVMDTARDEAELRDALAAVANKRKGIKVNSESGNALTFTSCG